MSLFTYRWIVISIIWGALFCGCCEEDTPVNNFELLWHDFDMRYAQFEARDIDWDAVYDAYRPRVHNDMSDDALFDLLSEVLGIFNDNHISLSGNDRVFESGAVMDTPEDEFDIEVAKSYMTNAKTAGAGNFTFGKIADRFGYVHIKSMEGTAEGWSSEIDQVLESLPDVDAMIVDVRGNGGGPDHNSYNIAGRFADKKRLGMTTQYRNGPDHDDFGVIKEWYVEPEGPRQFTGPTILLTDRHSVSAAETFTLAMTQFPHITQMGSATSGAFANSTMRDLLNGWYYGLPIGLFLGPDGQCHEGKGIIPLPENQVLNTKEDIEQGRDIVLETAVYRLSQ